VWQVVSIISGFIAGLSVLFLGFIFQTNLWPIPDEFDSLLIENFLKSLPDIAFISKVITHSVMCFAGGLIASLVANQGKAQAGIITTLTLFTLVLYRDFRFVYPTFYVMSSLFMSGILGFLGVLIGSKR
jgi:hypothetical protein